VPGMRVLQAAPDPEEARLGGRASQQLLTVKAEGKR
jgi:hypothetical protein